MSQQRQSGGQRQQFAMDYIDVATRVVEFRQKYPNGSLRPADPGKPFEVITIGQETYIAVVAAAYRAPDDPLPGIGMAYEVFPGRTPYTRGSELQNAETSAWGRAMVAALAVDTRNGIASAEEVRNRQAERDDQPVRDVRSTQRRAERITKPDPDDPWMAPQGGDRSVEDFAADVARWVCKEADSDLIRKRFKEVGSVALDAVVPAGVLDEETTFTAGLPKGKPVTLRQWLEACAEQLKRHGKPVAVLVREMAESVQAVAS